MATVPASSTLQFSNQLFSSSSSPLAIRPHAPPTLSFTTRAAPEGSSEPTPTSSPVPEEEKDSFENRLSQVRLRYKSGTGKKAEVRKSRKSSSTGKKSGGSGAGVFLPPVPLKEPVSGGVKVDFGFSPYSEIINGRAAGLGLAALVLVELATGTSVIRYHSPSIVFLQVYFVAALTAVYCKVEKEKVSVWPQ